MAEHLLLTPGPTKIHPRLRKILEQPIIHHRTSQFQEHLKQAAEGLKFVLQTKNDVYLLASSGTGGMEAAVVSLLSPGDKAITIEGGKFGERWTELCKAYGITATVVPVEWGKDADPAKIKALLAADPGIKAVFTTLCETSTGVTMDIKALGEVVKNTPAVLVVDAISGLAIEDLRTDEWHVDVVSSASHKGFMLPPGLAMVSVSPKAQALMEKSTTPKYYFDLRKSKKAAEKIDTPFTPAIPLVIAINESIQMIKECGLKNWFAKFAHLAEGTRAAAKALGFTLLAQDSCIANALTAINLPASVDGGKLVKTMREKYGISVAGGQGHLKGKIIRIAHMGCIEEQDILAGIKCLETVLGELGYPFKKGAGLDAAERVFKSHQLAESKK